MRPNYYKHDFWIISLDALKKNNKELFDSAVFYVPFRRQNIHVTYTINQIKKQSEVFQGFNTFQKIINRLK